MWQVVKLESGEWQELGKYETLEESKSVQKTSSEDQNSVFYFWAGEVPNDKDESIKLFNQVSEANDGRINRVTIGLSLGSVSKDSSLSMCPGRCFCVIAGGSRRCETYWCSVSGWCWWVSCGMGC